MDFNKYYLSQKYNLDCYQFKTYNPNSLVKISPIGIYAVDPVVRRAKSLQDTLNCAFTVAINPINAQKLNILNNEEVYIKSIKLRVILNEQIPCGCILIDHINLNHIFGSPYQQLVIEKIKVKV